VRAAARGESKLHPMVAARVLREMQQRQHSPLNDLTSRELEVLTRIARGRSNHEIAQELVISGPTVRTHVANILSNLHLTDRTQAAIYALQQRLVPLQDALEKEE
jgi:two-component system, NarL family, response regulator LiaR